MIAIIKKYFVAWNNHDIQNLRVLMDQNIVLKDWNVYEIGIENVLKANANIFKKVPNIKAQLEHITESKEVVMVQIKVSLSDTESIDVVDVFSIKNGRITYIKAYRC